MVFLSVVLLFVLVLGGVPMFASLLLATTLPILLLSDIPIEIVGQRLFSGMDKFPLLAVPLFIFSANIMLHGGLSRRIVRLAEVFTSHLRGGIAFTTVISCLLFGAVSGSSPATVVAIGGLLFPVLG